MLVFTGIVEEVGRVVEKSDLPDAVRLRINGPLVTSDASPGDSIAVDGVSLTVSGLGNDAGQTWFEVSLIPTTLAETTLSGVPVEGEVNLEVDVIAKYVERLMAAKHAPTSENMPKSGDLR